MPRSRPRGRACPDPTALDEGLDREPRTPVALIRNSPRRRTPNAPRRVHLAQAQHVTRGTGSAGTGEEKCQNKVLTSVPFAPCRTRSLMSFGLLRACRLELAARLQAVRLLRRSRGPPQQAEVGTRNREVARASVTRSRPRPGPGIHSCRLRRPVLRVGPHPLERDGPRASRELA